MKLCIYRPLATIARYTGGMRKMLAAVVLMSLVPMSVLAVYPEVARGAGFASQSIFLSRSPVTEGESVRVYVTVSNPGADSFKGSVAVTEDGETIGTVPLTLATGGAQTVSVVWKPMTAGARTVKAALIQDGTTAAETQQTFTIQEKPKPKPAATEAPVDTDQSAAAVESSAGIQESIQSISPAAGNAAKPVFGAIDSARQSIANVADQQLANVAPKISKGQSKGQVEGAQTENTQPWYWSIVWTIYFYILTLVRFLVGSAGIFYPLLAILFLYFLYRMFRRYRRG